MLGADSRRIDDGAKGVAINVDGDGNCVAGAAVQRANCTAQNAREWLDRATRRRRRGYKAEARRQVVGDRHRGCLRGTMICHGQVEGEVLTEDDGIL